MSATQPVLRISDFPMQNIDFAKNKRSCGPILMCIGKRGRGKSFLIRDILWHFRDVQEILVISGSEEFAPFFRDFVPPSRIHYAWSTELLTRLIESQSARIRQWEERGGERCAEDPRVLLVMDDCAYDESWTRDKQIRFLFMNGRHVRILAIFSMQTPLGVPPALRGNIDYVFLMNDSNPRNRDTIYANYAGAVIPTRYDFDHIMNTLAVDHNVLVLDCITTKPGIENQLFVYVARERTNFRIGDERLWREVDLKRNSYQPRPPARAVEFRIERAGAVAGAGAAPPAPSYGRIERVGRGAP